MPARAAITRASPLLPPLFDAAHNPYRLIDYPDGGAGGCARCQVAFSGRAERSSYRQGS